MKNIEKYEEEIKKEIAKDEYEANCKEILATSVLIPKAHRSRLDVMDTGDWDSSGLCGVSALKLFKRGNS